MAESTVPCAVLYDNANRITSLAVLPDGCIASGGGDSRVRMWRRLDRKDFLSPWKCVAMMKGHASPIRSVVAFPDGCVASCSNNGAILVWCRFNHASYSSMWGCAAVLKPVGWLYDLAVLPDGCLVACGQSGTGDGLLHVWRRSDSDCVSDTSTAWTYTALWHSHSYAVHAVAVLSNERIASAGDDNVVKVWRRPDPASPVWESLPTEWDCVAELEGHTSWVCCLAVLHDGCLVSGSNDTTLRVWQRFGDASTSHPSPGWTCTAVLKGHTDRIQSINVLPDSRLASASMLDSRVRVWRRSDPASCTSQWICVAVLNGHFTEVNTVATLPDGCLVSGGEDSRILVWPQTAHLEWISREHVIVVLVMVSRRGWGSAAYAVPRNETARAMP